jgi:hypothetical protein
LGFIVQKASSLHYHECYLQYHRRRHRPMLNIYPILTVFRLAVKKQVQVPNGTNCHGFPSAAVAESNLCVRAEAAPTSLREMEIFCLKKGFCNFVTQIPFVSCVYFVVCLAGMKLPGKRRHGRSCRYRPELPRITYCRGFPPSISWP